MTEQSNKLNQIVNEFLIQKLNADDFERLFTDISDFEDEDIDEEKFKIYFAFVRQKLACFSPFEEDLRNAPDYYINEETLRNEILKKKQEMGL